MKYAIGVITGVLATYALVRAADVSPAYAAPPRQDAVGETGSMAMAVGSTEAGRNDLLFVLYKRLNPGGDPPERITLAVYKNTNGNKDFPHMELRSARELSYDMEIRDMTVADTKSEGPPVKDLKEAYEKGKGKPAGNK